MKNPLNRNMGLRIYGHTGRPILVLPTQDAMSDNFENFGMIDTLTEYIDGGNKLQEMPPAFPAFLYKYSVLSYNSPRLHGQELQCKPNGGKWIKARNKKGVGL